MSFTQEDMPSIREGLHRALLSLQEHVGETLKSLMLGYSTYVYILSAPCAAYADAGSDAEEAISNSEDEDVYDTTTEYDSDDEVTADSNTGQTQPSAAAAAQQQVTLTLLPLS